MKASWAHRYPEPPMPAIIKHPDVNLEFMWFGPPEQDGPEDPAVRARAYESGAIMMPAYPVVQLSDDDWGVLDSLKPAPKDENWWKKARMTTLLAPLEKNVPHVIDHFCPNDRAKAAQVQEIIRRETKRLRHWVKTVFPMYNFIGDDITWRFTPTEQEIIHYDAYKAANDEKHRVRVFVNLDTMPRVWGVSHRIQDMMRLRPEILPLAKDRHPNDFTNAANKTLTTWHDVPRHYVAFAPGNTWLVDSQMVAHEIVFGRKMVACTFEVDPKSLLNPENGFANTVRRTYKELTRA